MVKDIENNILNFPNLRFPEFEGEWEEYKVSDILEFFPTNSLSWEQLEFETDNIHNLHYGLIHKGLPTQIELDKCTLPNIKAEFIPNKYTICKDGDVAFADASEDTNDVGKVVEFKNCNEKKTVCGLHTIHGRDKLNLTIPGFNGYAFSAKVFRTQIRRLAQGTKIFSISTKNFDESYISIPSKAEQEKIANLLYLIDCRIQTQSQIIEDYKVLMEELNNRIYENFKHEKIVLFSELYDKAGEGGTPDTKIVDYYKNGKIPFVKIDDLRSKYLESVECYITDDGLKKSSAWIIPNNSIIFSNGATIGAISINKLPVATKQGILGIVLKEDISLEYIYYFMTTRYFKREICKITTHGTMKTAYLKDIDTIKCFLPNYNIQNDIANILKTISSKIEVEQAILEKLQKQKQFLLQQMFI